MHTLVSAILLAVIIYLYGRWFYDNRENIRYYLAPVWILAGCLLLAGMSQSHVFGQAMVERYSESTGWFDDTRYYEPYYMGEDIPPMVLLLGPIVGLLVMLAMLPRNMRRIQGIHFAVLLLVVYPVLSVILLVQVGGTRPRFYDGTPLPAIGTQVPPRS